MASEVGADDLSANLPTRDNGLADGIGRTARVIETGIPDSIV